MVREQRLCDVAVGTTVVVRSVANGPAGQGRRLEDLGIIEGTLVRVERRAPMGDPTIYEVRHARLAMRKADAALVQVLSYAEDQVETDRVAL
jgi:ferrous iron transport protein A